LSWQGGRRVHLSQGIGASTPVRENWKMMKRLLMIASMFALAAVLTVQASAKEITVRGHLEQTVEAGGWLIIADTDERTDKYLLLNPQRFRNEAWFRKGAQVEATGETKPDAVTIYQEGIAFEARTMRPIGSRRNKATGYEARNIVTFAFCIFNFELLYWQSSPNLV
jgi:hypothetical protein